MKPPNEPKSSAKLTIETPDTRWLDGVFQLSGLGKELWNREDPDQYIRKLREDWE